jgi:hypothetical protein
MWPFEPSARLVSTAQSRSQPSSCEDEVRSFKGQSGQTSALFSCSGGLGRISSCVIDDAPCRFEVPIQSEPVSPPPITITCFPEALIVPFGAAIVHRVAKVGGSVENVVTLPTGGLDGLVRLADGSLFVSSWDGKAVYHVDPQGQVHTILENIESPADIGYDTKRGRLLIPVFYTLIIALVM